MGGVVEVLSPQTVGNVTGEGGKRNKLRTTMEAMEFGKEEMSYGDEVESDNDYEEKEGGGLGEGYWHWKPQGSYLRMRSQAAQFFL